ncbi:glycosyltransferase family A protein [Nonlabens marinus]|uniref:Glycosyltransferase 2-like domain-containing protein n=1 Tax=Nonlabens marinus S1-08 TaxID=1454201 RepID=W8VQL8_9FLAO|nr:glycosyltransferase family A protein [Nonlabens marinus]BAO55739.1 hypothetical protein NMS_1730 [Nonlabens marinus S1-08]
MNKRFFNRIIIPVYIPDEPDQYHEESDKIFEICLNSLRKTINLEKTAITVINNGRSSRVKSIVFNNHDIIDKYVEYTFNKGKVYPILNEARSCYEPYITICDADVAFFEGWENAVFDIFKKFKKAGVVAPLPCQGLALNNNSTLFFDNYFLGKVKYGKIVSKLDSELYIKGLGNSAVYERNNRDFDWIQKQYFLEKDIVAIVGSGHFVATYKSSIFKGDYSFPKKVFENGYEDEFIDKLADINGFYRLSTRKSYAFHMGNKVDDYINTIKQSLDSSIEINEFEIEFSTFQNTRNKTYFLRNFVFKGIRKFFNL